MLGLFGERYKYRFQSHGSKVVSTVGALAMANGRSAKQIAQLEAVRD
jgi:hypothetical protein